MNRIVIAAVAVVLSNFALACAGGSIVDDAAVQDLQQNPGGSEVLITPPTQEKMGNVVAPELPKADKIGVKNPTERPWNDDSKDPLLNKAARQAVAGIAVPNVRGEIPNDTMDLPGVDVPNTLGGIPAGVNTPPARLPNTHGDIPTGATNIPSFELPNIHNDLPQNAMDLQPFDVQGVRVRDDQSPDYMK